MRILHELEFTYNNISPSHLFVEFLTGDDNEGKFVIKFIDNKNLTKFGEEINIDVTSEKNKYFSYNLLTEGKHYSPTVLDDFESAIYLYAKMIGKYPDFSEVDLETQIEEKKNLNFLPDTLKELIDKISGYDIEGKSLSRIYKHINSYLETYIYSVEEIEEEVVIDYEEKEVTKIPIGELLLSPGEIALKEKFEDDIRFFYKDFTPEKVLRLASFTTEYVLRGTVYDPNTMEEIKEFLKMENERD